MISCGTASWLAGIPACESSSLQSSKTYAVGSTFGFTEVLDKRLSLISPANARLMFTLLGTDEPLILGLSANQHTVKLEGSSYSYLEPDKVFRFRYGPMTGSSSYYAELLDYEGGKPVGLVYYGVSSSYYPYAPKSLVELCTGKYENVCTLNFNKETNLFSLAFKE